MKAMKQEFGKLKLNVDISSSQISNKVDQHTVKELEERFEKSLKGVRRDLSIKDKKIERLAKSTTSAGGGNASGGEENNQSSKKSLHGGRGRGPLDQRSNSLIPSFQPKLPFMKMGDRISRFGPGYSKLLELASPPQSPGQVSKQLMHPSGLMSPGYPPGLPDYNGFIPNADMANTVPERLNGESPKNKS